MQAVIFIGIQASGKTTFYLRRFFKTHIRLSLDMLRTRHREQILLKACLEGKQPFVIDNTNPTPEDRARYINAARDHSFKVIAYFFQSGAGAALDRNAGREGKERVPDVAILGTAKRLQAPVFEEGFDQIFYVSIGEDNEFRVEERPREL